MTACSYCTHPLPPEGHELCDDEIRTDAISSCPDKCAGTCPACDPKEDH